MSNPMGWKCRQERRPLDDQQLIKETLNGNKDAFKQLVQRYENQVAATVIGMLGHGQEAEDIGQETYIRFYRSLKKFRGEASLGTYLTRIAINLCINEIRRQKRRRLFFAFQDSDKVNEVPDKTNRDGQKEAEKMVHWGLRQLDSKHRAVLVLRLIDGYSTQETANILGLPLGTVLSRLARAQQKLRDILEPLYKGNQLKIGESHG